MTRKALLIGINYRGTSSELQGCINDVTGINEYLCQHGYAKTDITLMTDDTSVKPTKRNIINALMDLIHSGAETLYFHYSGHGSWEPDSSGDEADKHDECLVPLDYQTQGMIIDDQLSGLFSFMKPSSKMVAILDCCHSGTALDLCYTLTSTTKLVRKKTVTELSMKAQGKYKDTPGQVIMISGCADTQTSADAYINKKSQGALTWALLDSLADPAIKTWEELITAIRTKLRLRKYTQIANLTSGQPLMLSESISGFC